MRHSVDILVADDSDEDAALTLAALRRAAPDATVVRVKDGRDALQFLYSTEGYQGRPPGFPQLILLDVHMPVLDGLAVLKSLRSNPLTSAIPIVLFSSLSNPLTIERGMELGANDYRVKPVDSARYRAQVDDIVHQWLHTGVAPSANPQSAAQPASAARPRPQNR
jgi:CheY-like chemotaxis protein